MTSFPAASELACPIRLGLPIWGFRPWLGSVFTRDARSSDFLAQYASAFACVEGNTTFYNVPTPEVVERWRADTPDSFRFCFKFPRLITHDAGLVGAEREVESFLSRMAPLGSRLGPFMLQLPPSFGPGQLSRLESFLSRLPDGFDYAIEFRHPALFSGTPAAERALELLHKHGCDRIHLDTRSLRSGPQDHAAILAARHPKPDLPVETVTTAKQPIVRFIGHPEIEYDEAGLTEWAGVLREWVERGAEPYFFVHCPDDLYAPAIARRAYEIFSRAMPLPEAAAWPGESGPRQLSLW